MSIGSDIQARLNDLNARANGVSSTAIALEQKVKNQPSPEVTTITIDAPDTVTISQGSASITLTNGAITVSGPVTFDTAISLPAGSTLNGSNIATETWVTSNFSENDHTHTFSGTGSDGNTSITISGTTSGPST